ncbi:hypothetical protein F4821DRAFT_252095 [Hypoxylon rubiginosum]|uniref:Uncharacterized protein n=1 Tax=Hypoxylon rubiginosum TaxID=110542 RepID=A0ACC0CIJ4_9PEZI|nr:hypothetical protein F4821DRAFT_252095 [Hypoxylon rubiginosum]
MSGGYASNVCLCPSCQQYEPSTLGASLGCRATWPFCSNLPHVFANRSSPSLLETHPNMRPTTPDPTIQQPWIDFSSCPTPEPPQFSFPSSDPPPRGSTPGLGMSALQLGDSPAGVPISHPEAKVEADFELWQTLHSRLSTPDPIHRTDPWPNLQAHSLQLFHADILQKYTVTLNVIAELERRVSDLERKMREAVTDGQESLNNTYRTAEGKDQTDLRSQT